MCAWTRQNMPLSTFQSDALFRTLIATAVDGIIVIDARGTIAIYNAACERLFGYRPEEAIGHNVKMLMPAPYHDEHDGYLANYRKTGEKRIIGIGRVVVGRRHDGTTFPMELSVGEARHKNEPLFVGIIRDVTKRRQADEQRDLLMKRLTELDIERGHFAHVA